MGNCVCVSTNGEKLQSKLISDIIKKPSLHSPAKLNRKTFPKDNSALFILKKPKETLYQHSESFYTAYPNYDECDRGTINSNREKLTEYLSFDTKQMDMIEPNEVLHLPEELKESQIRSQAQALQYNNENQEAHQLQSSLVRDSIEISPKEIIHGIENSVEFQQYSGSESRSSETDDGLGFSRMTIKDVLNSMEPKVGYVRNRSRDPSKQTRLALNSLEMINITTDSEGTHRKPTENEDFQQSRECPNNSNSLRKESFEQQFLVRRNSMPPETFLSNSNVHSERSNHMDNSFKQRKLPHYHHPKQIIVEPLSPLFNSEESRISTEAKDLGEAPSEKNLQIIAKSTQKSNEEALYQNVHEDSRKFIQRGREALSLLLRILQNNDVPNGFERLYKAKDEAHSVTIYFNSIQKPNGQTIIKTLYTWEAPCPAETFIQLSNDIRYQSKINEYSDQSEEIDEIYSSESESFILKYETYKKVLTCKPRDVVYLKHIRKLGKGEWAEASVSVEHEDYPEYEDRVRSETICAGSLVSNTISDNSCIVKCYSEIDLKVNIPLFIAKTFITNSLKHYIARCISAVYDIN